MQKVTHTHAPAGDTRLRVQKAKKKKREENLKSKNMSLHGVPMRSQVRSHPEK